MTDTESNDQAGAGGGDLQRVLSGIQGVLAWGSFESSIRETNRYVPSDSSYFKALVKGCRASVTVLPQGSEYSRARIMPLERQVDRQPFEASDMGAPDPALCEGGRLNPAGIPYLYLASNDGTAIAETRPWRSALVSVGSFALVIDAEVVDLRTTTVISRDQPDPARWAAFALRRPSHRDDRFSYVATQLLAEHLKHDGFDGIVYDSSLRSETEQGHNLALFRPDRAVMTTEAQLFEVTSLKINSLAVDVRSDPWVELGE